MDEIGQRLKALFPRGSASFFAANAGLRSQKSEQTARPTLVDSASGKEKSDERVSVSYVLYRVRLLDTENAYGATKSLTDCLCEIGLLPGDAPNQVKINVEQEKVNHYSEQRTIIEIKYL